MTVVWAIDGHDLIKNETWIYGIYSTEEKARYACKKAIDGDHYGFVYGITSWVLDDES